MPRNIFEEWPWWLKAPPNDRPGKTRRFLQKAWSLLKKVFSFISSLAVGGLAIYLLN